MTNDYTVKNRNKSPLSRTNNLDKNLSSSERLEKG